MRPKSIYDLPIVSDPRLSRDGVLVAFTVSTASRDNEYRSAIWVVPSDGSQSATRLVDGTARDFSPRWSPDGNKLLFLSTRNGVPQIYVCSVDGNGVEQITDVRGGVTAACWSPDGGRIAFSAFGEQETTGAARRIDRLGWKSDEFGIIDGRFQHLFVVNVEGGEPRQLTEGRGQDQFAAWSPDGKRVAFVTDREPHCERSFWANDLYLAEVDSGELDKITVDHHHYGAPAWSPDGEAIACRHLVDLITWPRNGQIVVIDVSEGATRVLTEVLDANCAPMSEPREPIWDGGDLVFPVELHGNTHLYRAPANGSAPPRCILGGDRVISAHDLRGGQLVYCAHSPAEPAELFSEERRLTEITRRFRKKTALSPAERFEAVSSDGAAVEAWLIKPHDFQEGRRYPVLLFIHGGPFFQYTNGFLDEFQVAAEAGFVVLYANPRGSSGYGEAWGRALTAPFGGLEADARPDFLDLMAVVDNALERFNFCDRQRVGVLGGSYGGFMTAWIIAHTDRFAAACIERGIVNQISQIGTTDLARSYDERWAGQPYVDFERLLIESPIFYVNNIHTPVLLVHAEQDLRVSIGQAEELFTALKTLDREVEFARFPGSNHSLSRSGPPAQRVERFQIIFEWFARHLSVGQRRVDESSAEVS